MSAQAVDPAGVRSMSQLVCPFLSKSLVIRLFQFGMTVGSRCRNQLLVRQQYFVGIVLFSGLELNHRCW